MSNLKLQPLIGKINALLECSFKQNGLKVSRVIETLGHLVSRNIRSSKQYIVQDVEMQRFLSDMDSLIIKSRLFIDLNSEIDALFTKYGDKYDHLSIENKYFSHAFKSSSDDPNYQRFRRGKNVIEPDAHVFLKVCELVFKKFLDFNGFYNIEHLMNDYSDQSLSVSLYYAHEMNRQNNMKKPLDKQHLLLASDVYSAFDQFFNRETADFLARYFLKKKSISFVPILTNDKNREEMLSIDKREYAKDWKPIQVDHLLKGNKIILDGDWRDVKFLERYFSIVLGYSKPSNQIKTPYFNRIFTLEEGHLERGFSIEIQGNFITSMAYNESSNYSLTIDQIKYTGTGQKLTISFGSPTEARKVLTELLKPISPENNQKHDQLLKSAITLDISLPKTILLSQSDRVELSRLRLAFLREFDTFTFESGAKYSPSEADRDLLHDCLEGFISLVESINNYKVVHDKHELFHIGEFYSEKFLPDGFKFHAILEFEIVGNVPENKDYSFSITTNIDHESIIFVFSDDHVNMQKYSFLGKDIAFKKERFKDYIQAAFAFLVDLVNASTTAEINEIENRFTSIREG